MKKIIVCFIAVLTVLQMQAQEWGAKKIVSPEINGNNVTFRLKADKAQSVKVYGDFLPGVDGFGLGGNVEMKKNSEGIWEYTAKNLPAEFYFYYYEVDGVRVIDPNNLMAVRNYTQFYNTFLVKGEASKDYEVAEKHKGILESVWYDSPEYGAQRHMNVYLPYGYDSSKKYPVLYLQHGGGDDEETWVDMGRVCQIMDNLIDKGEAVPMIVVLPNTMPDELASQNVLPLMTTKKPLFKYAHTDVGFRTGGDYVNDLMHNIIPYVESHYSVKKDRSARAISGLSMGGIYSLYTIQFFPGMFDYIGIMGMGYEANINADEALAPVKKAGYKLFWIGVGEKDMALDNGKRLMAGLDRNNMLYTYYNSKDGHNWRSWRRDLLQLAPKLFR